MKEDIHPEYHDVCFLDVGTGKKFLTKSTMRSKREEVIDSVKYFVLIRDITSDTHPAYKKEGGHQKMVDTSGRIQLFQQRMSRARSGGSQATAKPEAEPAPAPKKKQPSKKSR